MGHCEFCVPEQGPYLPVALPFVGTVGVGREPHADRDKGAACSHPSREQRPAPRAADTGPTPTPAAPGDTTGSGHQSQPLVAQLPASPGNIPTCLWSGRKIGPK